VVALPDEAGFAVEDDGRGFGDADQSSLFDHGYTTDDDGTGFGLAIVARVVEAHGWSIRATESETGGARFEILTG
jgi:signal transduction histidine kinase